MDVLLRYVLKRLLLIPIAVGIILIILFGVRVLIFPVAGSGNTWPEHLWSLVLPGFTVAVSIAPILFRSLRASLIEALSSDYVAFARAKGTSPGRVFLRYGLRNVAISGVIEVARRKVAFMLPKWLSACQTPGEGRAAKRLGSGEAGV